MHKWIHVKLFMVSQQKPTVCKLHVFPTWPKAEYSCTLRHIKNYYFFHLYQWEKKLNLNHKMCFHFQTASGVMVYPAKLLKALKRLKPSQSVTTNTVQRMCVGACHSAAKSECELWWPECSANNRHWELPCLIGWVLRGVGCGVYLGAQGSAGRWVQRCEGLPLSCTVPASTCCPCTSADTAHNPVFSKSFLPPWPSHPLAKMQSKV